MRIPPTYCEWHSALHKGVGLDALYGQVSTEAQRPYKLRHLLVPVVMDGHGSAVEAAALVGPWLATAGSSGCIGRPGAVLGTREERPIVSDPAGKGRGRGAAPRPR